APPHPYPLSLHDALPISRRAAGQRDSADSAAHVHRAVELDLSTQGNTNKLGSCANRDFPDDVFDCSEKVNAGYLSAGVPRCLGRSEEHTSELQSLAYLVC